MLMWTEIEPNLNKIFKLIANNGVADKCDVNRALFPDDQSIKTTDYIFNLILKKRVVRHYYCDFVTAFFINFKTTATRMFFHFPFSVT